MSTIVSRGIESGAVPAADAHQHGSSPSGSRPLVCAPGLARALGPRVGAEHSTVVRADEREAGRPSSSASPRRDAALADLRADQEQHERQADPAASAVSDPAHDAPGAGAGGARASARRRGAGRASGSAPVRLVRARSCRRRAGAALSARRRCAQTRGRRRTCGSAGARPGLRRRRSAAIARVWWRAMAAGCVIGVDLGGTKLLAGVVDARPQRAPPRAPPVAARRPASCSTRSSRRSRRRATPPATEIDGVGFGDPVR